MSFNPLSACLVSGIADLVPAPRTVLELGNQSFTADNRTLDFILERTPTASELRTLKSLGADQRRDQTATFYRALGFTDYCAVDVNDTYGSLVMDLNQPLRSRYGFDRTFALVTNCGTGEHIFDQAAVFRNVHDTTVVGGLMLHALPFLNYVNHGFYSIHPALLASLAQSNRYELLALGFADRDGHGCVASPSNTIPPPLLRREDRVPLRMMLGRTALVEAQLRRFFPRIKQEVKQRLQLGTPLTGAAGLSWRLQPYLRRNIDLMAFAIMRKTSDEPFRVPIQEKYLDALQDTAMRADYRAD